MTDDNEIPVEAVDSIDDEPGESLRLAIERAKRHAKAPLLLKAVATGNDPEQLAEVAAAVEETVREECLDRDLNKYAGMGVCYLVVDRLAEEGADG